jgi:hypothetical protein
MCLVAFVNKKEKALGNIKSQKNRQKQEEHLFIAIHQSDVLPSNWT